MLDILQTAVAFVVSLGVLIAVHEYGHFWVARRCGVKVLRFSIGFGQPLITWRDKQDTEFVIAAIPFGGYVKMLGEPGSDVPSHEQSKSFAHKSIIQRICIVAAGPIVNLVFAVLLYWLIFVAGVTRMIPIVGEVAPDSPAYSAGIRAGDEIISVDGAITPSWEKVSFALVARLGDTGTVSIVTQPEGSNMQEEHIVHVDRWMVGYEKEGPLSQLGVVQFRPDVPIFIGELIEGKAAIRDGLAVGDKVVEVNGSAINNWFDWVDIIRANPAKTLELVVERDGQSMVLALTPDAVTQDDGSVIGQIGAAPQPWEVPQHLQREIKYGPVDAVGEALLKAWDFISLTLTSIGKMFTGLISLDNLSGPITIAKVAGSTANYGLEPFLNFVAYLSISLGVLNLLPIPVLDGGHLMYYFIELVKGSPVSEKIQYIGNSLGLALLVTFMGLAFYNDIMGL